MPRDAHSLRLATQLKNFLRIDANDRVHDAWRRDVNKTVRYVRRNNDDVAGNYMTRCSSSDGLTRGTRTDLIHDSGSGQRLCRPERPARDQDSFTFDYLINLGNIVMNECIWQHATARYLCSRLLMHDELNVRGSSCTPPLARSTPAVHPHTPAVFESNKWTLHFKPAASS